MVSNYKLKLLYKIIKLSLDVFHIAFLIISFFVRDPSPHPVGWLSSMSLFLMFVTYNKSLLLRCSTSSDYVFNILLLSDVILKQLKHTNRVTRDISF